MSKEGFHQRDGVRRQRWQHTLADGSHHRFTGALNVARAVGGPSVCFACRGPLTADQGPVAPARFGFDVETVADWRAFLSSLTGRPNVVVLDDDKAIQAGVRQCWPAPGGPHLHQCEHHLYARARAAMDRDQLPDVHPLHEQLNVAFTSPQAWAEFAAAVHANRRVELAAWVDHWGPQLEGQLIRRAAHPAGVPGHWANGAIEHPLKLVGAVVGRRAWTLRNRARMDVLLELVRLRVNSRDSARRYAHAITEHLTSGGHTNCIPDIADQDIAGAKVYSLRP